MEINKAINFTIVLLSIYQGYIAFDSLNAKEVPSKPCCARRRDTSLEMMEDESYENYD